jgi:opacity protein-like surface antigen
MRGNGISRCKGLAVAALSFALVGLPVGARAAPAAPAAPAADTAFCGALFSDYIFRGLTQSPHCAPPPPPEPVKLYSVGRQIEPAKLYSVGTLVRPPTASFAGWYISGDVAGSFNKLYQTETFTMTNAVTNQFSDSSNVVGGGFSTGFLVPLGNSPILIGPSASIEFLRQDTFHTFPGNFFIGQTINGIGTVNGQIGVAKPGLMFFGELGLGVVNVDQKLNFSGPVTSVNQNVTGLNVGFGFTFQPPSWQIAGNRLAIFTQINRIILPAATFENPGSQGYTYRNENDITQVKAGIRVQLSPDGTTLMLEPNYDTTPTARR